jgi:dipeptidyl aminopeptidase/acylaminoacyl peptidase
MKNQALACLSVALTVGALLPPRSEAQVKSPPTPAEWGEFEQLGLQPRGGLSPDGKWLVYGINRSNRNNELRIRNIASGAEKVVAFGAQPSFSADSKWVGYSIGMSEAQSERLRTQRRPVQNKFGLLKLDGTSEPVTLDGIESFAFDPGGAYLLMRRYAPERRDAPGAAAPAPPAGPPAAGADDPAPAGVTVLVRDLASGRDTTFGNISEFAWQNVSQPSNLKGRLLALIVAADDKIGNGIHVYDAAAGSHRVLDSSASIYTGLSWRRDADDLVVLRGQSDERREGSTHTVLAWTGVAGQSPGLKTFDPARNTGVPAGMRTVSFRRPSWSDDGRSVFVGVAPWEEKLSSGAKPAPSADAPAAAVPAANDAAAAEDTPSVDIWHAKDIDVMPRQKLSAGNDRRRNLLAVWHLADGRLVQLGKEQREQVSPIRRQAFAYVANWAPYAMNRSIGRPSADISLIDLGTGARTKVADKIDDGYLSVSAGGRYLLYFQNDHFWTINTETRAVANLTKNAATSFADRESDATAPQKPPFGVAGWSRNDDSVLIYDKFDIWRLAPDGTKATRLTDGAAEQVRHRYARINPDEEFIDLDKPLFVTLFGTWTKRSGYGTLSAASRKVERLIFEDKAVAGIAKAKDTDVFAYTVQAFDDSPDLFISDASLENARQATATNPLMSKYAWGRSEVVEYKSDRGERLQGSLHYPANYEPGRKYPMVVYLYERLSDGVHRFVAPSERDYYNASAFTSQGYVFFQPDIVFRPREPGLSVLECVGPAVKKVVAMGVADPARVGVVGHSWGGFDASYLATHSTIFAAAVAGAAITDLVSNYGNHHWSSGIAETDHIETGQQRMEVPLWEDLPAYIRNSAVFNVQNMKTPLLLEVGDSDGTVFWHQGVELYNIARRAKKDVVMLAYAGEDHGLRRKANQIDYQRRILSWFGHYLKNEPAPPWITSGLSFLEKEQELKKAKSKKGS